MKPRLEFRETSPSAFNAMIHVGQTIRKSGLEESLINLVDVRASQINGCGWCLDMHTKDALALGETEQRLLLVSVWREANCYTDRERAALAWTEAVTEICNTRDVPDDIYEMARAQFSEKELVDLTLAVIAINGWNRFNVAFRSPAGDYVSPHAKK